jgi:uncharacterized Zn-binding protein involved in type VI secretion
MYACNTKPTPVTCSLDVCKTPTSGPPAPVPYPNIAFTAHGKPAASKVRIAGFPALTKKTRLITSTGDEPGVAGGVRSSTIKGIVAFTSGSGKVFIQGSPAVRQNDTTKHNNGNGRGEALTPCQLKVLIKR